MKELIVILGHTNDILGNISEIAKSRLNKGILIHQKYKNSKILLTGGYGEHFNLSQEPHALYAKEYLLKNGIQDNAIHSEFVLSKHTTSDAIDAIDIIHKINPKMIFLITSEFHQERAGLVFKTLFPNFKIKQISAKTPLNKLAIKALKAHEEKCLENLYKDDTFQKYQAFNLVKLVA